MGDNAAYSKREIDQLLMSGFKSLHDRMDDFEQNTTGSLGRIETQTIKTNGRVSKLEQWKNYVLGGIAVLTFLVTTLIAVLGVLALIWKH
jgi:hypothetical protein